MHLKDKIPLQLKNKAHSTNGPAQKKTENFPA